MSSHHFVKEKQEPALYIHSNDTLNLELLAQLLEWSPYVIVDEHTLYMINHEPIKIDLVVQQELSIDDINLWIDNQSDVKVFKVNKETNKLQAVLDYLEKEQHFAISLVACNDKSFEALSLHNHKLDIIQYSNNYKGFYINNRFSKWMQKDAVLEINNDFVETKNLKKCTTNWKVIEDGIVEILVTQKTYIKEFKFDN